MRRQMEAGRKPETSMIAPMEEISVTLLSNFSYMSYRCRFLYGLWWNSSKPKSCGYVRLLPMCDWDIVVLRFISFPVGNL